MKKLFFVWATCLTLNAGAQNVSIHVSPTGNDGANGTATQPVATLQRAQQLLRACSASDNVEIVLADGTYYLDNTLELTAADSKASVTLRAANEGMAVLSGGRRLQLDWSEWKDGIYMADVNEDIDIDQLYINGERQRMARFPNPRSGRNVFDVWNLNETGYNASMDALTQSHTSKWAHPEGGYIHAMHAYLWGDMHYLITSKNADGTVNYVGGWQNNRPSAMHGTFRFVENIFEELDVPGEWYYDKSQKRIYYMPEAGTDLQTALVEVVRLPTLVSFKGTKESPVKNIMLKGFVFRHAARTFMDNKEPLLRSDWTINRVGAVQFEGAVACGVSDSKFDQLGGNSVMVSNYNRQITISGCHIHEGGASGVAFVGNPDCVRDKILSDQVPDYENLSYEKGPDGDDYPDQCTVSDCLIERTGRDEKQTAGVQISMSHGITVDHCSIYDVPRAGVNISEGTFGGHRVSHCDIFNTVLETGDHGSFNSWGRDRYYVTDINKTIPYTTQHPELPYLDMLDKNELCYTRWRCDHGWDIDLDDGSSWYEIHHNVLLNGGLKMRDGYGRKAWNNVILNNSLHPHVWYSNSEDEFYSNIVMTAYRPAEMTRSIATNGKWGKRVDYNLFAANESERTAYSQNSCDAHSISDYPQFVDSVGGDYRVKETSKAIDLGFENFAMDDFGVIKPSLRAIAKTPELPTLDISIAPGQQKLEWTYMWLDVLLREPMAQELSAYGVAFDEGGVAMTQVQPGSVAAEAGFLSGDLIQGMNDTDIHNIDELRAFLNSDEAQTGTVTVHLVRTQGRTTITLQAPLAALDEIEPAFKVPGRIEAEQYTSQYGVQTEPCNDQYGGQNVGWIHVGDWMEYPIDVEFDGTYTVTFRAACEAEGGTVDLVMDGDVLTTLTMQSTGSWTSYVDNTFRIPLTAGRHQMRLLLKAGGYNLNWFNFEFSPADLSELNALMLTINTALPNMHFGTSTGNYGVSEYNTLQSVMQEASSMGVSATTEQVEDVMGRLLAAWQTLQASHIKATAPSFENSLDLTECVLVERSNFSAQSQHLNTQRFGTLSAPWRVSENLLNQSNGTQGGFDNTNGSSEGNCICVERWYDWQPAIYDGTICQTSKAALPAGTYTLDFNKTASDHLSQGAFQFHVFRGTQFLGNKKSLATFDLATGQHQATFTLDSDTYVTAGWVVNLPLGWYQMNMRVNAIHLYDEAGNDVSADYLENYEGIQRGDMVSDTRYGTPVYWTTENVCTDMGEQGLRNGIDSNPGYNCLQLSVWNDKANTDADLANARLYRTAKLPAGRYYFGATYDACHNFGDDDFIFVAPNVCATSEVATNAIAYATMQNAPVNSNNYHGIVFTLDKEQEVVMGWQMNLADGAAEQEMRVNRVLLLAYDHPEIDAVTIGEAGYATYITRNAVDFGPAVEAYVVTGVGSTHVALLPITSAPAGTPVVLKASEGGYAFPFTTAPNPVGINMLQGSEGFSADGSQYCLSNKASGVGFYKVAPGVEIPAGHCYLVNGVAGAKEMLMLGDETETGLDAVQGHTVQPATAYDLLGRSVKRMQRGLYIVNGKKVLVR